VSHGRCVSRRDLCHKPVAETRHRRDVGRLFRVVTEHAPQRRHGLIHGIRRHDDVGPDAGEQVVDADDLARALGETQQQPHRPLFEPDALFLS
jgi:hypothetical protein